MIKGLREEALFDRSEMMIDPLDLLSPHVTIDARLAEIAETSETMPPWYDAWRRLGPRPTAEERLAVYQAVRDAGSVPDDAGFYLVAWQVDDIASQMDDAAMKEAGDRMDAMRREHGLGEDEYWRPGEGPPEYAALVEEANDAWNKLFVRLLEQFGEYEMAELFLMDHDAFLRRSEAGRIYFHGSCATAETGIPEWLSDLGEHASACITSAATSAALGGRYSQEGADWDVFLFLKPVEIVVGPAGGTIVHPPVSLDLERLRDWFDEVDASGWESSDAEPGPHVWIEGWYDGKHVRLRVLARAPDGVEPAKSIDPSLGNGRAPGLP